MVKGTTRRVPPTEKDGGRGQEGEEMKKQVLKGVTMLVSIIVLAFATALASSASDDEPARSGGPEIVTIAEMK